jgi:hypothetical protein
MLDADFATMVRDAKSRGADVAPPLTGPTSSLPPAPAAYVMGAPPPVSLPPAPIALPSAPPPTAARASNRRLLAVTAVALLVLLCSAAVVIARLL